MSEVDHTSQRYLGHDYLEKNPSWDLEDSPWKARQVRDLLAAHQITPRSIVDVGCGAGLVLAELQRAFPAARLCGYDIAPDAERFWTVPRQAGIDLSVGDFATSPSDTFDVVLALDVLEHLQDPFVFLERIKGRGRHYVFHFPLDLSALSVLRESPLLHVHDKVGHLHFFTRRLALALLQDCGYTVLESRYTGAALSGPRRRWQARLAQIPRKLVFAVNRDVGARLLGGETLMVIATADVR